ncbi:MAG: nucleoside triphosphate pyrophosphohydrolase [Candidatus Dadabacteria bacterium]|nr:MAG: nucleoside triphosphate pyrophosphohydrolase [Candidatus Dadabacteria bacterium]
MKKAQELFGELLSIIKRLRDPENGCPWDLKQTHKTLKPYLIEESYELLDAIDNTPQKIPEELGDVLLQVVLHSQIGSDEDTFTIEDVLKGINQKLIERHPHIFADTKVDSAEEVLENWEAIKNKKRTRGSSMLDGVPEAMPALLVSHRLGEKTARVGFDWERVSDVKEKVVEELGELVEALESKDSEKISEEFGDLLFVLAQLIRKSGFNAEELLKAANKKFINRFKHMEQNTEKPLEKLTAEELEALWQEAKSTC